jgi:transposase
MVPLQDRHRPAGPDGAERFRGLWTARSVSSDGMRAFPEEFRRDVVAVARKGEAPITQIAKDFGVSPAALHRWMKIADREDGVASGAVSDDAAKLREANKRIRLLEQEAEVMRRAVAYLSRDINPKK